jgi:nitrate/nitrite transporter NarK
MNSIWNIDPSTAGQFMSIVTIFAAFLTPMVGILSDNIGKKIYFMILNIYKNMPMIET